MPYRRNDEALRELLETYQVEGTEVTVPIFGEATILRAIPTNPVRHVTAEAERLSSAWMSYLVLGKKPVPFAQWVIARGPRRGISPNQQMTLDEWKASATGRERDILPMPDYLRERLEKGGTLSWADVEHEELLGRNCLDDAGNVTCYTFWSKDVVIQPEQLEVGSMVEHQWREEGQANLSSAQGVIIQVNHQRNEALMELFTPLPYLLCPNAIDNTRIKKSFHPEATYALSYGTYEAFEIAEEESGEKLIPEGKWDDEQERRLYTLKEFLPLSVIQDFCREAYAEEGHCFVQSLILYVVPMFLHMEEKKYEGLWHPLVKNEVPPDAIISYDVE